MLFVSRGYQSAGNSRQTQLNLIRIGFNEPKIRLIYFPLSMLAQLSVRERDANAIVFCQCIWRQRDCNLFIDVTSSRQLFVHWCDFRATVVCSLMWRQRNSLLVYLYDISAIVFYSRSSLQCYNYLFTDVTSSRKLFVYWCDVIATVICSLTRH